MGMGKANETGLIRLIDARTVLVIVLCSGIASMFARSMATHLAYLCVMTAFLVLFGKGRQGLACVLVYGLAMGGLWLEVHHGILAFPSPLLLSMIYRMIPTMMSLYLLILIPSGKLTAGLGKKLIYLHVCQRWTAIPGCHDGPTGRYGYIFMDSSLSVLSPVALHSRQPMCATDALHDASMLQPYS